jgi:aromatic-amino-acid transaminase
MSQSSQKFTRTGHQSRVFDSVVLARPDALLALIDAYRADPRDFKMDLGVGVYRDERGRTPILACVKAAENILWKQQQSKSYLGAEGNLAFVEALTPLVFGDALPVSRWRLSGLQAAGGTGALRLAAELLRVAGRRRIWIGKPTWLNHESIFRAADIEILHYDYFDRGSQSVRVDAMLGALEAAQPGDAFLLHGACHNPTGADLDFNAWRQVTDRVVKNGLLPVIDIAYQGFGRDADEDVAGPRFLLAHAPAALVAVSCSKTFGLYRERTGAIFSVTQDTAQLVAVRSNLVSIGRAMYSMPPDHGAAIVSTILQDPALTAIRESELAAMRERIAGIRQCLAAAAVSAGLSMEAIARQHGMFSLLDLTNAQVDRLRQEHGIYMAPGGRINVAGLTEQTVPRLVRALSACMR